MTFAREKIAIAFTVGALVAGAMPGCISDKNNGAAPSPDGGEPSLGDSSAPGIDATVEAAVPPGEDGGFPEDANEPIDSGPPPALIRFAWFVGGVAPVQPSQGDVAPERTAEDGGVAGIGYDVCVAPHGTGAWMGPLLASSSFAAGLQPFEVTAYFPFPAGQYDARIVAAGSTTCDLPDAGPPPSASDAGDGGDAGDDAGSPPSTDFTSLPAVTSGSALTAVLVDPLNPAASIADLFTFTDDTSTTSGMGKLRFINVSENDTVTANPSDGGADAGTTVSGGDFGIGGGILFDALFTNVTSQEHLDPTASSTGYREMAPFGGVNTSLLPVTGEGALSNGVLSSAALSLDANAIVTAFYASESGGGGETQIATRVPVLVWCYDAQASATSTLLTKCAYADGVTDSSQSYTRFGDFSADGDDRDVCVKYDGYGSYTGPLLRTSSAPDGGTGIPAQFLSAYFNMHGGLTFDARFVNAGAADCSTAVAPDTTYSAFTALGGGYTSVLLTGYAVIPADAGTVPAYDAGPPGVLYDDAGDVLDAGPQPTSGGLTTLATSVVVIEDIPFDGESSAAGDDIALAAIRLIHLAAQHPQPIAIAVSGSPVVVGDDDDDDDDDSPQVGLRRLHPQATTEWDLDNVPYGGFSTRPGPTDPYGYEPMTSGSVTITFESDAPLTYSMDGDQISMFAFDSATGVQFLACDDFDEETSPLDSLYTQCCVVGSPNCGGEDELSANLRRAAAKRARSGALVRRVKRIGR